MGEKGQKSAKAEAGGVRLLYHKAEDGYTGSEGQLPWGMEGGWSESCPAALGSGAGTRGPVMPQEGGPYPRTTQPHPPRDTTRLTFTL